jgi:hypothetical protein
MKGISMKKSTILIVALIVVSSSLIIIQLSRSNLFSHYVLSWFVPNLNNKILRFNQSQIDEVITLCESDDDITAFTTKAWSIWENQIRFANQFKDILKQRPELANKIDELWMEVIYILGSSLENDANELRKQKKSLAIAIIAKQINPETLMNYLQMKKSQR